MLAINEVCEVNMFMYTNANIFMNINGMRKGKISKNFRILLRFFGLDLLFTM